MKYTLNACLFILIAFLVGPQTPSTVFSSTSNSESEIICSNKDIVARSGCCSWHGGVCGCNAGRNRIKCCDGTLSPSCTCSGY